MVKKYIILIFCCSSIAFGSLDIKEKQLITALRNQYIACKKQWTKVSRCMSQGKLQAYKVAKMQAQAQEKNKKKAERALAAYRAKQSK